MKNNVNSKFRNYNVTAAFMTVHEMIQKASPPLQKKKEILIYLFLEKKKPTFRTTNCKSEYQKRPCSCFNLWQIFNYYTLFFSWKKSIQLPVLRKWLIIKNKRLNLTLNDILIIQLKTGISTSCLSACSERARKGVVVFTDTVRPLSFALWNKFPWGLCNNFNVSK